MQCAGLEEAGVSRPLVLSLSSFERTWETPMHAPESSCCCKPKYKASRHKKSPAGDGSRLLFGIGVALLAMSFVAGYAKPAGAQSADAEARCTGDVMRLCSEFVPDADSIVVCLKAKR